jgi:ubiquitin-protein ligase
MDKIYNAFLDRQFEEGTALARASDLLTLVPLGGPPPTHYVVKLRCKGLLRNADGEVAEAGYFEAGIWFPSDYLRQVNPPQVLTWFGPPNIWHPNISDRGPFICAGKISPGTPLVDLIYQIFEIVTYTKVTMREDDALNKAACVWARQNKHRFPIDKRPLKRRALNLEVEQP